jgi:hypothetical protein
MTDIMKHKDELINNFIINVNRDNAHDDVEICALELLSLPEKLPVIFSGELFVDCLLAYFESVEKYEICAQIVKNRQEMISKLIPMKEYLKQWND